jgi:hypothetical protein
MVVVPVVLDHSCASAKYGGRALDQFAGRFELRDLFHQPSAANCFLVIQIVGRRPVMNFIHIVYEVMN